MKKLFEGIKIMKKGDIIKKGLIVVGSIVSVAIVNYLLKDDEGEINDISEDSDYEDLSDNEETDSADNNTDED